jgi:hypothetical protein
MLVWIAPLARFCAVNGIGLRLAQFCTVTPERFGWVLAGDLELGSAAAVDPEASAAIDSPGLVLDAGRAADLAAEGYAVGVVAGEGAPVSAAIVGGAGDGLGLAWALSKAGPPTSASTAKGELGAAAAIDPETAIVDTPGLVLDARGAAELAAERDSAEIAVGLAPVSASVVGGASDDLALTSATPVAAAIDDELGAAAVIDPEAAVVDAPGLVFDAGRAADLAVEADAAASVYVAPISAAVIGGAVDDLALTVTLKGWMKIRDRQEGLRWGVRDAERDECG